MKNIDSRIFSFLEESILDEPEETAGSVSKPLRVARQLRGEVAGYP
jgi:hypothetical protein